MCLEFLALASFHTFSRHFASARLLHIQNGNQLAACWLKQATVPASPSSLSLATPGPMFHSLYLLCCMTICQDLRLRVHRKGERDGNGHKNGDVVVEP